MDTTSEDGDYEVSAEMLIHEDIDDERTLQEEEERMEEEDEGEDTEDELIDLQKESELPLEEILASYGYSRSPHQSTSAVPQQTNKPQLVININEKAVVTTDPKPHPPELIHVPPEAPTPVRQNFEALPQQQEEPGVSGEEDEGDVPPASSEDKLDSVSGQSGSKSPWFRPGANPEALARLRPVPERRSIRMGGAGGGANSNAVDNAFKAWLAADGSGNNDDSSNDDSDEDYYVSNDWKKYIMIGNDYQARIPSTLLPLPSKKDDHGQLLWDPSQLDDNAVSNYLSSVSEVIHSREGLPGAPVERDNEDALYLLVDCKYDVNKGLTKYREGAFDCKGMSPWTEEECRKFEIDVVESNSRFLPEIGDSSISGLRTIGKDFFQLQKQVPTRTVKEVVEFYYLWKKTERYDIFSTQQSKNSKKYSLRPGYISDFMDDFLEPPDPDFPDLHYGTTTMSAEIKKDRSQHLLDNRLRDSLQKTVAAKSS